MKKAAKRFALSLLLIGAVLAAAYFWRFSPTYVKVGQIERGMTGTEIEEIGPVEAEQYCRQFTMTPAQFERYFLDARPIFDIDVHDYAELPCFYKATVGSTEYRIYEDSLGWVKKGSDVQWYGEQNHASVLKDPINHLGTARKGPPFKE